MQLLYAQQVRELDRRAIEEVGVPGVVLMENAGRGATEVLCEALKAHGRGEQEVWIFAGPGNNGGDGYVIARHLHNAGVATRVFVCVKPEKIAGDAGINYHILTQMSDETTLIPCLTAEALQPWLHALPHAGAIVDALLGTGLRREVSGWYLELIEMLNACKGPLKLAVDIPSGLDADTGVPKPTCFAADVTTTFACPKVGMWMPAAAPFVGRIEVVDIGMPHALLEQSPAPCTLLTEEKVRSTLPARGFNTHKGSFGHLLVVAGSAGKSGAAMLSSLSALRGGVGLCTLATSPEVSARLESRVMEVMVEAIPHTPDEPEDAGLSHLTALAANKSAMVLGPGLSQDERPKAWVHGLLRGYPLLPTVLDADGLNVIVGELSLLKERTGITVLTPHPGEMGRLCGRSSKDVQQHRLDIAKNFAQEHDVILVLKGARTLIAAPDGQCWLNPTGNPGLASGGSGDVLAGLIGAFLAQGCSGSEAACLGVFAHGLAADIARETQGMAGLLATDVIAALGQIWKRWESQSPPP